MKKACLLMLIFFPIVVVWADLSDYARTDPRLSVTSILKSYDQIQGFQSQAQKWERDFKGKYGTAWRIMIDVRSGRPGHVYGGAIPLIAGLGNDIPYDHEIKEDEILSLARDFLKSNAGLFGIDSVSLAAKGVFPVDDFWYV